jgi:glycosyltransferase involved in cell wall biosynthesis
VSASTAADLIAIGVGADRVHTIEMGSDPVEASAPEAPLPLFVALGRLVPHKRIGRLLELWEQVRPVTGGRLVIVGDGPEAEVLRADAGSGVEFAGAVDDAEKRRLLSEAWLLVHPAAHEGWGTVVMEAAAVGTPTVAYDVRGVRDSVVAGETGVLAADDGEFVAAWTRLASDDEARGRLGRAARARARGFTWERAVGELERVLREVSA